MSLSASLIAGPAAAQIDENCEARDPTTAEVNSREGVRLAKAGRFEEAIALFRIANTLDQCAPDHRLLLARALARFEKRDEATKLYNEVMLEFPGTPEAERARFELMELSKRPIKPRREVEPPTRIQEPAPPPPPREAPWRIIGLSTAGAGALALVGGVYFALDSQDAEDQLDSAQDKARYEELVDQRSSSRTLAYVFYGLGGAMLVGGAAMTLFLGEDAPLAVAPTPGGGLNVSLGLDF